jgi:hypothetical protein
MSGSESLADTLRRDLVATDSRWRWAVRERAQIQDAAQRRLQIIEQWLSTLPGGDRRRDRWLEERALLQRLIGTH